MLQPVNNRSIMLDFADSTGLSNRSRAPRRYLWTDAFAVCNYLELYRETGEQRFLQLALKLVGQVHQVLGQHRKDSAHKGWLSGLDDEEARLHPTLGGLRIGKRLTERKRGETFDESLEWDQDGQYFHYLTKWMHALYCVGRETGQDDYLRWALELAKTAHRAFTYTPVVGGIPRMYWKMSIDLSRPLVDSMGQHDPLDGLISYLQLQAGVDSSTRQSIEISLNKEVDDMRRMCAGIVWATGDPLGIGGLLTDAHKLIQLVDTHQLDESARLKALLRDVEYSLQAFVAQNQLSLPAEYRLAFRELGLAIGLSAISKMNKRIEQSTENPGNDQQVTGLLKNLSGFTHLFVFIEDFWLEAAHQLTNSWRQHADINNVMLATALAPDGYLQL
ncbi:MAG: hypothetical protein WBN06_11250 [Lysobacterales bacterium]